MVSLPRILRDYDQEEERLLNELRRQALALHVLPSPASYVDIETFDKDGNILDIYRTRSKSLVRNAYNIVTTQLCAAQNTEGASYGAGGLYNRNTAGSNLSSSTYFHRIYLNSSFYAAAAGVTTNIVAGSNSAEESFEHHSIQTLILNGTTVGRLSYAASESPVCNYDSDEKVWTTFLDRVVMNTSGDTVTIREIALYVTAYHAASTTASIMLARDVLSPVIEVLNLGGARLRYALVSPTYPA
jgi:hypothetical protein